MRDRPDSVVDCPHRHRLSSSLAAEARYLAGIPQEFTGSGVGSDLFQEVEMWARVAGVHRLELTVMTDNEERALWVKGACVDEYYMGKVLAADHQ